MILGIAWYWWIIGISGIFFIALVAGWIRGAIRDGRQEKEAEDAGLGGASEDWGKEVHVMVVEASLDRTADLDMTALHDRLALEDAEIKAKKSATKIVNEAVFTLTDDDAWAKYLTERKKAEVKNV